MKRFLAFFLVLTMLVAMSTAFSVSAAPRAYVDGDADVKAHIGDLTVTKINGIWAEPTANNMILITPGQSISGLYYEKLYAKYNEELGCYEVLEKVANHRSYTKTVATGHIGLCFNYAPLTTAGSDIAKENWYVWQHIRVGDRLYLSDNIDLSLKNLATEGIWGTSSYKSQSFISVETVRGVYDDVTPYSNKSIVAQGDSITVGGGWTSVWGDYFHTTVINSGFGGDTAHASLASRYNTYVAPFNPEIVIVSFGINDAFSGAPSQDLMDRYEKALRDIYAENTKNGATTVFMNANVIKLASIDGGVFDKGDYSPFGGEEAYLDSFVGIMKTVAEDLGCVLIDLYSMWKSEGLSPDNIIDSCHPNGHGYDMNWTVQKPALIENMQAICGDTIRVLEGTTVGNAVNGMTDCLVKVKNQLGNEMTDTSAKLLNGYVVEYSYNGKTVGTFTVETFGPDELLVSVDAAFSVRNNEIIHEEGLAVQDLIDGILNYDIEVKNSSGTVLSAPDALSVGDTVSVTLNAAVDSPVETLTVVSAVKEDDGPDDELPDPYEGWVLGENILKGMSYTTDKNAFWQKWTDDDNTLLTDGKYRGDGESKWSGDNGTVGVSVEYAGTSAINAITFAFEEATDIQVIVLKSVRVAANRGFKLESVGVSTDGASFTNLPTKVTMTPVEGAPGYGTGGLDQYYDITVRVDIEDAKGLKVSFGTDGQFIAQLDEIQAGTLVEPASDAILGDVNGDGKVTSLDAALVLQYDAGLKDSAENGDVNGDGKVTSLDAARILQYDAGLIKEF